MEKQDDVQLIHAVLSGDETAFDILMGRYQKSVHAYVWQKIGDFHHAQEITQDTFFRAYQKLSTLREPSRFLPWLFVIAKNLCLNWLRDQQRGIQSQSLEDTPRGELAASAYTRYVSEQRETEATEHRSEIIEKLLAKLPEGERTVIMLHYLGGIPTKEISKSEGVSEEAIRTRLHRARKRLREEEVDLIRKVLGGMQILESIKQNVMRKIVDLKPTASPRTKPFLPWVAIGTAVVVAIVLLLSVSNVYLPHLQKLYSLYFAGDAERRFDADFTLTLGTHRSGVDLLENLKAEKIRISEWAEELLENPEFPVAAAETTVEIVVVSMLELGFAEEEFATRDTIYARAKQRGLEMCPAEAAVQLRLQFRDQPDWTTRERLSEFFVASEPLVLTRDGFPKIFSVVRDDDESHPETGISLWLIAGGAADAGDVQRPIRRFSASDPDGVDHFGRFAFVIPK